MAGLVIELQRAAVDPKCSTVDLLRKARLVSSKLRQPQIDIWLADEVNGYEAGKTIPPYRRIEGIPQWRNPMLGWRTVMFDDDADRIAASTCSVNQPISELANMTVRKGNDSTYSFRASTGLARIVAGHFGEPLEVRVEIPHAAIARIVEAVRDRILDWAIELERAGVIGDGFSFATEEVQTAQTIVISNSGMIQNIAGIANMRGSTNVLNAGYEADLRAIERTIEDLAKLLSASGQRDPAIDEDVDAIRRTLQGTRQEPNKLIRLLGGLADKISRVTALAGSAAEIASFIAKFKGC